MSDSSKSVLIVEDERVLQEVYQLILTARGYSVYVANNGIEGIAQLKKHKPDLVLLDIFMPIMDGKEFLRNINTADYPDTTIIAYTNLSDRDTEAEMIGLGASKLVLKASMSPVELVKLIADSIG